MKKRFLSLILSAAIIAPAMLSLTACGVHKHSVAAEYEYNETYHWHNCESATCEEELQKQKHIFVDTTEDDIPATREEEGKDYKICVVCDYKTYDVIPKITGPEVVNGSKFHEVSSKALDKYLVDNTYSTFADERIEFTKKTNMEMKEYKEFYLNEEEASAEDAVLRRELLTNITREDSTYSIQRVGSEVDTMFKIEKNSDIYYYVNDVNSSTNILSIQEIETTMKQVWFVGRKVVENSDPVSYEYYVIYQSTTSPTVNGETMEPVTENKYYKIAEVTPGEVPAEFVTVIKNYANVIIEQMNPLFFNGIALGGSGSGSSSIIGDVTEIFGNDCHREDEFQKENDIYINNTKISGSGIATISSEQMSMYVELNSSKSFKGDDLFQSICNVSTKMSTAGKSIAVTAELGCKSYRDVEAFELPDVTDYTEDTTISHSDIFSSAL